MPSSSPSLLFPPFCPQFTPLPRHVSHHCYRCLHGDDHPPPHTPSPPLHDLQPCSRGRNLPRNRLRKHTTAIYLSAQLSLLSPPSPILPFLSLSLAALQRSKLALFKTRSVKLIQHPTATHPDSVSITKSTLTSGTNRSRCLGKGM